MHFENGIKSILLINGTDFYKRSKIIFKNLYEIKEIMMHFTGR